MRRTPLALLAACCLLSQARAADDERYCVVMSAGGDGQGKLYASVSSVVKLREGQSLADVCAGYARLLKALFPTTHAHMGAPECQQALPSADLTEALRKQMLAGFKQNGYKVEQVRFSGDADRDIAGVEAYQAWRAAEAANTEAVYAGFLKEHGASAHADAGGPR